MRTDSIATEVRAVRDRLAARFDYDLEAIFMRIEAVDAKSGRSYVRRGTGATSPARGGWKATTGTGAATPTFCSGWTRGAGWMTGLTMREDE